MFLGAIRRKKMKKTPKTSQELLEIKGLLVEILQAIKEKEKDSTLPPPATVDPISSTLNWLSIPSHIKGYTYCEAAIDYILSKNGQFLSITKELNPFLAEKFDTTPSRIERSVRHAIQTGFARNPQAFGLLFPINSKSPTNSEFLFRVAKYLIKGC